MDRTDNIVINYQSIKQYKQYIHWMYEIATIMYYQSIKELYDREYIIIQYQWSDTTGNIYQLIEDQKEYIYGSIYYQDLLLWLPFIIRE